MSYYNGEQIPSTSSATSTTNPRAGAVPDIHYSAPGASVHQHTLPHYGHAQPLPYQYPVQNLQSEHPLPPSSYAAIYGAEPPHYYQAQHPLRPIPTYPAHYSGYVPYPLAYPAEYLQETHRGSEPSSIPLLAHQPSQYHQPTADYADQIWRNEHYENLRTGFSGTSTPQTTPLDLSRHSEVTQGTTQYTRNQTSIHQAQSSRYISNSDQEFQGFLKKIKQFYEYIKKVRSEFEGIYANATARLPPTRPVPAVHANNMPMPITILPPPPPPVPQAVQPPSPPATQASYAAYFQPSFVDYVTYRQRTVGYLPANYHALTLSQPTPATATVTEPTATRLTEASQPLPSLPVTQARRTIRGYQYQDHRHHAARSPTMLRRLMQPPPPPPPPPPLPEASQEIQTTSLRRDRRPYRRPSYTVQDTNANLLYDPRLPFSLAALLDGPLPQNQSPLNNPSLPPDSHHTPPQPNEHRPRTNYDG